MTPSSAGKSQDFPGFVTAGAAELVADAAGDEMEDIASNATAQGRQQNRRVTLRIVGGP